jgi:cytochrome c oxidase assembly protein subunit 19
MAVYNQKMFKPTPPDKGSFPIDHDGECRPQMILYLECLQKNDRDSSACRDLSQKYLKCRMDTELMAKEDWSKLGFKKQESSSVKNLPDKDASKPIN